MYEAGTDQADETLRDSKSRYWDTKARRLPVKAGLEENAVYPKAEVEQAWTKRLVSLWMSLDQLGGRLSGMLAMQSQEEAYKILKQEVYEMQKAYAEHGKYCPLPVELRGN